MRGFSFSLSILTSFERFSQEFYHISDNHLSFIPQNLQGVFKTGNLKGTGDGEDICTSGNCLLHPPIREALHPLRPVIGIHPHPPSTPAAAEGVDSAVGHLYQFDP